MIWQLVIEAAVTVTEAKADFASLLAVTVADPCFTPVTRPAEETFAMAESLDVQEMALPDSTRPSLSRSSTESWKVAPNSSDRFGGDTVTVATGAAVTVT